MPSSFRFPGDFEIWLPLALDPVRETQGDFFSLVEVMGRLKPDVMVQQAQTELNLISQQATTQLKDPVTAASLEIYPLHQQLVVGVRPVAGPMGRSCFGDAVGVRECGEPHVGAHSFAATRDGDKGSSRRASLATHSPATRREHHPRNPWWSTGVAVGCVGRERDCVSRAGRIRQFGSQPEWDSSRLARLLSRWRSRC